MKRLLIPCVLLGLVAATAYADADKPADTARKVIEGQLDAFARDDADAAYAYAAPGIQAVFPDASVFLLMVARRYPQVYRHQKVEFGDADMQDGYIAESVLFTDDDGKLWQAIYKLEQEPDGHWTISGCVLSESTETGL